MPSGFHDVQLPPDISRGATGGPVYKTTKVESASGYELRNQEWDSARYEYSLALEAWDPTRLAALIDFFHARAGDAYGFRFRDHADCFAGLAWSGDTLVLGTPVQIGTGTGALTTFQLSKPYTSGGITRTRKITRPVSGTVRIFFGSTEQTTGFTVNHATGVVTFSSAPANATVIKAAYEFDVPVRFDGDRMSINIRALQNGEWQSVSLREIRE
jgi:uncharacterized protein (TIGR02217 family)